MVIIPRTMTVIETFQMLSLAGLTKYTFTIHLYSTYQYKQLAQNERIVLYIKALT